tara:strand:+ start:4367 stop:4612 length:246 start_codon:yes stop_codon:yes gene_type:complete
MDDNYDGFINNMLDEMIKNNYPKFMNTVYNYIVSDPESVIRHKDMPADRRRASLGRIIEWFEQQEEYEKCENIKQIRDLII